MVAVRIYQQQNGTTRNNKGCSSGRRKIPVGNLNVRDEQRALEMASEWVNIQNFKIFIKYLKV